MKLDTSLCIQILTQLKPIIQEEFKVKSMSLFGSTARGDQRK